ncbi:hypothetical protein H4R23_005634, partial [Coemansia sp. Cherry 401B]
MSTYIIGLYQSGFVASYPARCEKDDSGGGLASGYINFTTGNGDALEVIQEYQKTANYTGGFDKYIGTLKKLAATHSSSTAGLDGYCDLWTKSCKDPNFFATQIAVANSRYQAPSLKYVKKLGIQYAVSRSVLYDTAIVNGPKDTSDNIGGLVRATNAMFTKNTPGNSGSMLSINGVKVDEIAWLKKFLQIRLSKNGVGDKANVNGYLYIIKHGNYDWDTPVKVPGPDGKIYTSVLWAHLAKAAAITGGSRSARLLAVLSLDAVAAAASTAQCSSYISYQIINLYKSGSVFSNPNNCAKDLGGLGYTAGFVKFSTKRGDLFQVVDDFKQTASYKGEFDAYYSTLEKYASKHSGSTQNLDGLCNVWYNATTNPDFYTL